MAPRARRPVRGDEADLFELHHDRLVRLLEPRLRIAPELAEEAAAIAWLQLLAYQPDRERVFGWLYTVAKHEVFHGRRLQQRQAASDELERQTAAGGDPLARVELVELLELLPRLRPQQRLVLWLQLHGHSYRDICAITGQTYTWVNRHLSEGTPRAAPARRRRRRRRVAVRRGEHTRPQVRQAAPARPAAARGSTPKEAPFDAPPA